MFGYLASPCRHSCGTDRSLYRSYFCGLSNALRDDYGAPFRFLVNRDSTFLSILHAAQNDEEPTATASTCCNPLSKNRPIRSHGTHARFAAAVTVSGLGAKLEDDVQDERGLRRWLAQCASTVTGRARRHAATVLSEFRFPVEDVWARLRGEPAVAGAPGALERYSEPTEQAYSAILRHTSNDRSTALGTTGALLGRAVYFLDAVLDLDSDRRHGRFNPLTVRMHEGETRATAIERAGGVLRDSVEGLRGSFSKVSLKRYRPLLDSILIDGLSQRIHRLSMASGAGDGHQESSRQGSSKADQRKKKDSCCAEGACCCTDCGCCAADTALCCGEGTGGCCSGGCEGFCCCLS